MIFVRRARQSQPCERKALIDRTHDLPFAGSRMSRDLLNQEGAEIGRRHMATPMRRIGIEAIYRKPNTSKPAPVSASLTSLVNISTVLAA